MSSIMKRSTNTVVLTVMLGLLGTIAARAANDRTVDQYTCKEVMRESGASRNAAIAFLHGFILGKSGGQKFNLEALTKQTDAFTDKCLDKPGNKAIDVMMKVKK